MWADLAGEVAALFSGLAVFAYDDAVRIIVPEERSAVVARVARWRRLNRARRNATARANYAKNSEERAAYQRAWQKKKKEGKR